MISVVVDKFDCNMNQKKLFSRFSTFFSCFLLMTTLSVEVDAAEVLNIKGGTITGNREQPKVLYIIPWRQPQGSADLERPVTTQVNDVLKPIDRSFTLREIDYYNRIKNHDPFKSQNSQTETQSRN